MNLTTIKSKASSISIAGITVIPFINPIHVEPYTAFHTEWIAVSLGILGVGLGITKIEKKPPPIVYWLVAFALVLVYQQVFVNIETAGRSSVAALCILWAAMIIWYIAASTNEFIRISDIAIAIVFGCIVNAGAVLAQCFGLDSIAHLVFSNVMIHGSTIREGYLAQENQLADYMTIGLLSVIYLHRGKKIGFLVNWILIAIFTAVLVVCTSRAVWLYLFAAMCITLTIGRAYRSVILTLLAVMIIKGVMEFTLPFTDTSLQRISTTTTSLGSTENARLYFASKALEMYASHPLLGIGFNQYLVQRDQTGFAVHSHNAVMQILAETGIIGFSMLYMAVRSWVVLVRKNWYLLSALSVLAIHSMLEYPLWYMHFLGLFAILVGFTSRTNRNGN